MHFTIPQNTGIIATQISKKLHDFKDSLYSANQGTGAWAAAQLSFWKKASYDTDWSSEELSHQPSRVGWIYLSSFPYRNDF